MMINPQHPRPSSATGQRSPWCATALAALCLAALPFSAQSQAVVMAGSYGNFDVLNDTGGEACGFEMEVWGVSKSQLTRIFPSNFNASVIRYGFGAATDFPGGTYVRWMSPYDAATGKFTSCTPVPPTLTRVPGDSCWTLGMPGTYATAGCEHFGISTYYANPTKILYRWLLPDAANPGQLIRNGTDISIPSPIWSVVQPANPALPPVVVAEIQAPPPPPARFGDARWVKVYKNEVQRKVDLDELVGDNPAIVAQDAAHLEVSWSLLQADPPGGNQRRRGRQINQGNAGNGNHAVVRRYEYYRYAGVLDPLTNEALCADLTCTAPSAGELGNAIAAQNAAANLDLNALTVTMDGSGVGRVSSADKIYDCGTKCYGVYNLGSAVTLTAKANSGSNFATWGGACAGNAATCTVAMNAEKAVTATFTAVVAGGGGGGGGGGGTPSFTLSIGKSNAGAVTSTPAGINCGSACAAKFSAGSSVTLVATPPPGLAFLGWSGACSGSNPSCTVSVNADTKAQASFSK